MVVRPVVRNPSDTKSALKAKHLDVIKGQWYRYEMGTSKKILFARRANNASAVRRVNATKFKSSVGFSKTMKDPL